MKPNQIQSIPISHLCQYIFKQQLSPVVIDRLVETKLRRCFLRDQNHREIRVRDCL